MMRPRLRLRSQLAVACLAVGCWLGVAVAQVPTDYVTRGASLPCLTEVYQLRVQVIAAEPADSVPPFDRGALDSMVASANAAFAPICVGFEVCEVLDLANYRYAADSLARRRERRALYTDPLRIDLFVTVRGGAEPYGQATFNGIAGPDTAYLEVPRAQVAPGSKALTHELGHYFGLYDTFVTEPFGAEAVRRDECATTGDLVCDTPADPYEPGDAVSSLVSPGDPCRFTSTRQDDFGRFYVPHTANAMSYYADECTCGFTAGQLRRVAEAISRVGRGPF